MAGITQLVDERIEQLRKERAELDELRASLERREADIENREQEFKDDLLPLNDRKEALLKEIETTTAEVERLRAERNFSIENFGDEMDSIHAEKTAESAAYVKQLQNEIAFMEKGRAETADEINRLRQDIADLEEKASRDKHRIVEEKDAFLIRTRAEREASLREINLTHSVAMADLDREKKAIEDEISAMEQTKTIEWNKIQAEISRYRTTQFAELDTMREQFLADMEKEKSDMYSSLRAEERKQLAEISRQKREWEQEALKLHAEKQTVLDEIKLLQYEYEKAKSENTVKLEKARVDVHKELEAQRVEALAKLDDEQSVLTNEWRKQTAELRTRHREELAAAEKELAELESKKATILGDVDRLAIKFDQIRAENEIKLESLKLEKLKELDELRLSTLENIEQIRHERVAALEKSYLEKATDLEAAREEKFEACRKAIIKAESELGTLKQQRFELESELEAVKTETARIQEENKALQKAALLEKHLELERLTNGRMAELENICISRLSHADELVKRMTNEAHEMEEGLSAQRSAAYETLAQLRQQISGLEAELTQQKEDKLAAIQKDVIKAQDELSKLKLSKLSEIELYLETYKQERFANIQKDLDRFTAVNDTTVDKEGDDLL